MIFTNHVNIYESEIVSMKLNFPEGLKSPKIPLLGHASYQII